MASSLASFSKKLGKGRNFLLLVEVINEWRLVTLQKLKNLNPDKLEKFINVTSKSNSSNFLFRGKFSFLKFSFQRYMRLTPSVAAAILLNNSLAYYLMKDAPPTFLNYSAIPCEKFWWSALLHLQVYANNREMVKKNFRTNFASLFNCFVISVHAHDVVN